MSVCASSYPRFISDVPVVHTSTAPPHVVYHCRQLTFQVMILTLLPDSAVRRSASSACCGVTGPTPLAACAAAFFASLAARRSACNASCAGVSDGGGGIVYVCTMHTPLFTRRE
jgi:hypothetical protein